MWRLPNLRGGQLLSLGWYVPSYFADTIRDCRRVARPAHIFNWQFSPSHVLCHQWCEVLPALNPVFATSHRQGKSRWSFMIASTIIVERSIHKKTKKKSAMTDHPSWGGVILLTNRHVERSQVQFALQGPSQSFPSRRNTKPACRSPELRICPTCLLVHAAVWSSTRAGSRCSEPTSAPVIPFKIARVIHIVSTSALAFGNLSRPVRCSPKLPFALGP